ncbi:MAG: hypothetical protein Ct9H300mP15_06350 [Gemmatimonadota bacterium]|nr:MAG: hypothetical protein Ct9H300mP15_06350 [Gemmatimonadota bacterium]
MDVGRAYGRREQKDGRHLLALLADCCVLVRLRQAGTSLNLFARDSTNLSLFNGALEIQASQLQSVNALFIILLGTGIWFNLGVARRPE